MGDTFKRGACALAILLLPVSGAAARHVHATRCASPVEVTAIAATSIQQQLMVAALTCSQIANFNAFQTNFGPELRSSDKALMHMFMRLYGSKGAAEYHGFKTRLANNSEMRSIHGNTDYCSAAGLVFAAALAANKPSLSDFVSGVQVADPSPVDSCQMQVATGLQGVMSVQAIQPRQKPAEFQDVAMTAPAAVVPQAVAPQAAPAPASPPSATTPAAPAQPAPAADAQPKKKSGWFSGIFD